MLAQQACGHIVNMCRGCCVLNTSQNCLLKHCCEDKLLVHARLGACVEGGQKNSVASGLSAGIDLACGCRSDSR